MTSSHLKTIGSTDRSDETLLSLARAGDGEAYAELFRRHHDAALRAANAIAGQAVAEDLAAEAFARTWRLISAGGGPRDGFRSYLIAAIRNAHIDGFRKDGRLLVVEDPTRLDPDPPAPDQFGTLLESTLVTDAFATLPDRWREVLWLTTVEGRPVAEVAELMGIGVGAAHQLAYRAREALRLAYLAEHVREPTATACRAVAPLLTRHARGALAERTSRRGRVESHLRNCLPCTAASDELAEVAADLSPIGIRTPGHRA